MGLAGETILKLPGSEVIGAVELLTRAFWDDPFIKFVFPDDTERKALLPQFFRLNIEHAMMTGEIYTTSSFKGIAVWRFPGDETRPSIEKVNDPRMRLATLIGQGAFQRLISVLEYSSGLHKGLIRGKHCYLLFLGVEPVQQRKGVGSLLLTPVLKKADEGTLTCYLETMKEENLAFYYQHGFYIVGERRVSKGGPYMWALIRSPLQSD